MLPCKDVALSYELITHMAVAFLGFVYWISNESSLGSKIHINGRQTDWQWSALQKIV